MAETTYSYLLVDFPNNKVHVGKLEQETQESDIIIALRSITADDTSCAFMFKDSLTSGDITLLDTVVSGHDGSGLDFAQTITLTDSKVSLLDEMRDRSGKLRIHQTSRKLGLRIMWTGVGDDPTDITKVGGGTPLTIVSASGTETIASYIDLNIAENETWIHEGYMTWDDAQLDTLTVEVIPRTVNVSTSSGTNYSLYGGYMVIPAAGNGTISLDSDITTHSGGLIYMPNNDLNEAPIAFWDAEWDSTTKEYKNITPVPYGNGRYNMFSVEISFARFLNRIPLLRRGFIALNSSDTDSLGHGMRLKLTSRTNSAVDPHAWSVAFMMCLHRERSI